MPLKKEKKKHTQNPKKQNAWNIKVKKLILVKKHKKSQILEFLYMVIISLK